jgi:hypothetical protein
MVWKYEESLINECGYKRAQVRTLTSRPKEPTADVVSHTWAGSVDTLENDKQFNESTIWDLNFGFGGNGEDGTITKANTTVTGLTGSCVRDGPSPTTRTHSARNLS